MIVPRAKTVPQVLAVLQARPVIRGEMVLLLEGRIADRQAASSRKRSLAEEVDLALREGLLEKDALKQVAKARGLGKSEAYREWQRRKR